MNWRHVLKTIIRRRGFDIIRTGTVYRAGAEYTRCYPYDYTTYSPWNEDWFQKIYDQIKNRTVITPDRCFIIYSLCNHCKNLAGDVAECGVYKGGSSYLIASIMSNVEKYLHLFDTFEGMPEIADADRSRHRRGDYGDISLESIKAYLDAHTFIKYYPGVIPERFDELNTNKFSFVHIDVDLYSSVRDSCHFFYDRVVPGGVMLFDDYGFPNYKLSAKKAVDDFFEDKSEVPIILQTGQCVVYKLPKR